ncbi:AAA family ATPase [Bifidobacterium catulorum]|uniref:ATPase dynein-related AAA domain-containing protein n=1 Tax=Bifidobacterium catulorum TaxID=1630173 RepID=A0A2U2MT56_9BIFI|nr:AAA family ATPase [Bifidobacterium catulorum]PWG60012.1 hypothetical protein DF200_04410 [Bifidobacterium catulorum]
MAEVQEFKDVFAQKDGRIFALLISVDGRGHTSYTGKLSLDYCKAGQSFDVPVGLISSKRCHDGDVVLVFAKLDGEESRSMFQLVDVQDIPFVKTHSGKSHSTDNADLENNGIRSGSIEFIGKTVPLQDFYEQYQNRIILRLEDADRPPTWPCLLDYNDVFYATCDIDGNRPSSYNDVERRQQLFEQWLKRDPSVGDDSRRNYVKALAQFKKTYFVPTKKKNLPQMVHGVLNDEGKDPFDVVEAPYANIFSYIDDVALRNLRDVWSPVRKLYDSRQATPVEKFLGKVVDPERKTVRLYPAGEPGNAGSTSAAIGKYIEFLCDGSSDSAYNLIYFGAPGTGKSTKMNQELRRFIDDDGRKRYERVTFYPDYLHAQFVGSYRPKAVESPIQAMDVPFDGAKNDSESSAKPKFTYAFAPGPFTRVLVNALNEKDHEFALAIEEINRADPAAVFGDIFQLLDRDAHGKSEFPISVSEDMKAYLWRKLSDVGKVNLFGLLGREASGEKSGSGIPEPETLSIVLPPNMVIWATMNSADQGVYPLDTAFKRRWNFRYVGIDDGEDAISDAEWKEGRRRINALLLNKAKVNEDKLLGPFFLGSTDLEFGTPEFDEAFKNKVIMYLFDDAARYARDKVFDTGVVREAMESRHGTYIGLTLSALFEAWDEKHFEIFGTL